MTIFLTQMIGLNQIDRPCSEIVGIPVTPLGIRHRVSAYIRFFDETAGGLFCIMLEDELSAVFLRSVMVPK